MAFIDLYNLLFSVSILAHVKQYDLIATFETSIVLHVLRNILLFLRWGWGVGWSLNFIGTYIV